MNIIKLLLLISFSTLCTIGFGQNVTWQKVLQNTTYGTLYKVQQAGDGGYVAVGEDRVGIYYKIFLTKLDEFGNTSWYKYYDLSIDGSFTGYWIEETHEKGLIITGSGEGPNNDTYLIKTDSIGNF